MENQFEKTDLYTFYTGESVSLRIGVHVIHNMSFKIFSTYLYTSHRDF